MTVLFSHAVLCAAEVLALWLYGERMLASKRTFSVTAAAFAAGYLLLVGVFLLVIPVLNVAAFFIVSAALLLFTRECGVRTAAIHAALLTLAAVVSELVVSLAARLLGQPVDVSRVAYTMLTAPLSRVLFFALSVVLSEVLPNNSERPLKKRAMLLGMSGAAVLLSSLMLYLGSYAELTRAAEGMIVRNSLTLLAVYLLVYLLFDRFGGTQSEEPQPVTADDYYEELQKQYDSQRRLVHDIKNHLHAIEGLAAEGGASEVVSYISGLEGGAAHSTPVRLTADPVLNSILVRFRRECGEKGLRFSFDLREGEAGFLDAPDVTTLYGNLLSNAVEAAEISDEKAVELSVVHNVDQQVLIVSVDNSCDEPPLRDASGRMLSRKRGGRVHGVGLKNIERVVEKYGGIEMMYYSDKNRRFHHVIQFPLER